MIQNTIEVIFKSKPVLPQVDINLSTQKIHQNLSTALTFLLTYKQTIQLDLITFSADIHIDSQNNSRHSVYTNSYDCYLLQVRVARQTQ